MYTKKKISGIIAGLAAVLAAISLTACGQKESADAQPINTEVAEQTAEASTPGVQETVEETEEVPAVEKLPNTAWVAQLNLDKPTFLIFNDTTGERKVLEDGQEYTLVEGDELAIWRPQDWDWEREVRSGLLFYSDIEAKYGCWVYDLYDRIGHNTMVALGFRDSDDNEVLITTIYLSTAEGIANEEWVESLSLDKGAFIIFNNITGERKVLEDGAEYTLVEGDQLIGAWPSNYSGYTYSPLTLYNYKYEEYKCKYECWITLYDYDCDIIDNNTEEVHLYYSDGNYVESTLYLSK